MPKLFANSGDPDQTPRSAVSELWPLALVNTKAKGHNSGHLSS